MSTRIRLVRQRDIQAVAELALAAWPEVHASFERILGHKIYHKIWPDWHKSQAAEAAAMCEESLKAGDVTTWVAEVDGTLAGFLACKLNRPDRSGEVEYLAVHPDFQGQGIGTALNRHALEFMKREGMVLAQVGTGGDPAHAAARRSYEKAGYTAFPQVRYYKYLD